MKTGIRRLMSFLLAAVLFVTALPTAGFASPSAFSLPADLKEIGVSAFENDTSLEDVVLPEGLRSIGSRAFAGSSIRKAFLPDSLRWIADDAFEGAERAELSATTGSYAWRWLYDYPDYLTFLNDKSYEVTVDMGFFAEDPDSGLFQDPFVQYYHLANVEEWYDYLGGDPVWTVTQTAGPEMDCYIVQPNPYCALVCVDMPGTPGTGEFDLLCDWDGLQVGSHIKVNYVVPDTLPTGLNVPDEITVPVGKESVFPMGFLPAGYSFGAPRGALEDYNGNGDSWFVGNTLHIIPRTEGTYTGTVRLYAGNINMAKSLTVHAVRDESDPAPWVRAVRTDRYTVGWNAVQGVESYTVRAYQDAVCETEYANAETEDLTVSFDTDVDTPYWFTVEYTAADGDTVCSGPVHADPLSVLAGPRNVSAETEDGTVYISWDAVPGAAGYRIYYSDSGEWTPDTSWITQENGTENRSLTVGENKEINIWVCAMTENGPNTRTGTLAFRYDNLLSVILAEGITLYSLAMNTEDYPIFPTEGVTDPEALETLNTYNTLAAEYNAEKEAYNARLQETIEANENFLGYLSGSPEEGYSIGGYRISAEAMEIMTGDYEVTDSEADENALVLMLADASGGSVKLRITDTGIGLDDGKRSRTLNAKAAPPSTDEIGLIGAEVEFFNGQFFQDVGLWAKQTERMNNRIRKLIAGDMNALRNQQRREALRIGERDEAWFRYQEKIMPKAAAAGAGAGVGDDLSDLAYDTQRRINLGQLMDAHGHPTYLESLHDESYDLTRELLYWIHRADWLLLADQCLNIVSLGLALAPLNPGAAFTVAVVGYGANRWLNESADEACAEINRIDGKLHYSVDGTVRDKTSGETLADVEVTCEMPPYKPMTTRTDENGMYHLEPLTQSFTLKFREEKYKDLDISIPEAGREVKPDVPYPYHAEMELREGTVMGRITDKDTKQPIRGVTVSCGEDSTVSDAEGWYTLYLPPETVKLHFDREGYISDDAEVEIRQDEVRTVHKELRSCYIIRTRTDLVNVKNEPGASYCLGNDIDLSDAPWTPVCWFSGELDGRGFAIRGMSVTATDGGNSGLFAGLTSGALIKDLCITGASVTVASDASWMNTGLLCGNILGSSTVRDSTFEGTISVTDGTVFVNVHAGGVSGMVTQGTLLDCEVNAEITAAFRGQIHVGGIYGQLQNGSVSGCHFSGDVRGNQTGNNSGVQVYAAGIGYSGSVYATGCTVSGSVYADTTNGEAIAVGLINASVGINYAGVHAVSDSGRAYAAGCQDGSSVDNRGAVSANCFGSKNADAAGLNRVYKGSNTGSVSAHSAYGDSSAIGAVDCQQSVSTGSVSATSGTGNHYAADYSN